MIPGAPREGRRGLALLGAWMLAASAWAAPPPSAVNPKIDQAQRQMDAAEFEGAAATLNEALADPDNTTEALATIYRMLGNCYLYLDDQAKARSAFERLLQVQPDYELPATAPPKLRAIYQRIKEDIGRGRVKPVRLTYEHIPSAPADRALPIAADIGDMPLGGRARVYYRKAGTEGYSSIDMKRKPKTDTFTATLPAFELTGGITVEYYMEVSDAAQRRVAGAGDPLEPLHFQVVAPSQATPAKPADDSGVSAPTVLAIIGGVILVGAAAAGATYLILNQPSSGNIVVTVRAQ